MPKEFMTDPNSKSPVTVKVQDEDISSAISSATCELRALVAQVCDVSQELMHLNAALTNQQDALLAIASAILIDPDTGMQTHALSYRREVLKKQLGV